MRGAVFQTAPRFHWQLAPGSSRPCHMKKPECSPGYFTPDTRFTPATKLASVSEMAPLSSRTSMS